jgi:hypothetical protein
MEAKHMLVEKDKSFEGKIVSVKLVNSEEILAFCVKDDHTSKARQVVLRQPVKLMASEPPQTSADGLTKVAFYPWIFGVGPDEDLVIKNDHILVLAEAGENAARQYKVSKGLDG